MVTRLPWFLALLADQCSESELQILIRREVMNLSPIRELVEEPVCLDLW